MSSFPVIDRLTGQREYLTLTLFRRSSRQASRIRDSSIIQESPRPVHQRKFLDHFGKITEVGRKGRGVGGGVGWGWAAGDGGGGWGGGGGGRGGGWGGGWGGGGGGGGGGGVYT